MTEKHNAATHNRPSGDRVIDAPSVFMDIPSFIAQIKSENAWRDSDRNSITVFKTGDLRIVLGGLHQGAELPPHKADGIMNIQVLEGILAVTAEESNNAVNAGQMIAIHKNCNYWAIAVTECIYLLTLSNVG